MLQKAVILAGGLGSRLYPLTASVPKPLLPLGSMTILETQILLLREHGLRDIYICTGHLAERISSFLGDGWRYGVKLHYSREISPLGTCGPLALLKDDLREPFLVLNGDVLTTFNFDQLSGFAADRSHALVAVTRLWEQRCEYGEVLLTGDRVSGICEKRSTFFEILCGIYLLQPRALGFIPLACPFGMNQLIEALAESGDKVSRCCTDEYWIDIGQKEHYERAKREFDQRFGHVALRAHRPEKALSMAAGAACS